MENSQQSSDISDFRNLTCTNLMLKLKILTNRLSSKNSLAFYCTREQHLNIKKPFSSPPFQYSAVKLQENKYQAQILKQNQ